ncbi:MAG: sugar-binding protein [Verrucomicrobiota bacterium JB024]|nr:sugar-binding protein [Verrucomicrobiota bacterium JB024]
MSKRSILSFSCLFLAAGLAHADKPSYTAYRLPAQTQIEIDGDLSEWPQLPVLLLGNQDQVSSGKWNGPGDSLAKVRITWDDRMLYMAIEVTDDDVVQTLGRSEAEKMHREDCIQFAVDLNDDGGGIGYGDDNYEYGLGVVDGEPVAYRWYSSSGWPVGLAEHIDLAVVPAPQGGLVYEAAIDYSMLAPLRNPEDGRQIGFTIVLQDMDGHGSKALQWTPGVVTGKTPSLFGKLIFSRAAPSADSNGVMVSAPPLTGLDPLDVRAIPVNPSGLKPPLSYRVIDASGKVQDQGKMAAVGDAWTAQVPCAPLKPGEYRIDFVDATGRTLGQHVFTRVDIEHIREQAELVQQRRAALEALMETAEAQDIETRYALNAVAAARLFKRYTEWDLDEKHYEIARHNVDAILTALDRATAQLQGWMDDPESLPAVMRVPDLDYTQTAKRGEDLVVDGQPVLLIGPGGWVWQLREDLQEIHDVGFNAFRFGWAAQHHFDKNGQLKAPEDMALWTMEDILDTAEKNKMAAGISVLTPAQVWRGLAPRGEISLTEFHEIYDAFAQREIPMLSKGRVFDYVISIEGQRAPGKFDAENHQKLWEKYLADSYTGIVQLNELYGTDYKSYADVPFPQRDLNTPAKKYDNVRFRQIIIGNELSRAADVIRREDPGALVQGYPYVWTFRDAAAYYEHALDPELDTANYDMVGCDTSGSYESDKYALPTINWIASYYDLMKSIADDRPLFEGEYHFANQRRTYPDNWARAIYVHSYMHGLDGSHSWVWARTANIDAALLYDANILLGSGQASLDLQRLAPAITAFHHAPRKVALVYSNASSPHTRRTEEGVTLSQMVQTDAVYEGIFFEGLPVAYVTELKIQEGYLDRYEVIIVPNASHVEPATRDAIEAYARKGGRVLLVGDCLKTNPQGVPLTPLPELPSVTAWPGGFTGPEQAHEALMPILREEKVLPSLDIRIENDLNFPTVEWRQTIAPDGSELIFVLNMGHGPATVTLPADWDQSIDQVTGQPVSSEFPLKSLEFRLLQKKGDAS